MTGVFLVNVLGFPIPIIYGEDDTPIMDQAIFDHVAKLVVNWFKRLV